MNVIYLILYSRKGCCLCDGLELRLKSICLQDLNPPITLKVVDIDGKDVSESQRVRYDLKVPVMAFFLNASNRIIELPNISPRIKGKDLMVWLQQSINKENDFF
tara:strand:- start:1465 stop:1776 length:312 start_codon:yes stop_codon:yes gene_type:complete